MPNEISEYHGGAVSEHLRKLSEGTSFGNLSADDLKPPQLKLLAGQSPEVLDGVPDARPGNFWVTVLNQNIGTNVIGSPLILRKTYQVWTPRGGTVVGMDGHRGPLAVASDGINWDVPNLSFEVKFPMNPRTYTWTLGRTVFETGAQEFGTQQDDDPKSKPIAAKTFDVLWLLDMPHGPKQIAVFRSAKTGQRPTENMANAVEAKRRMQGISSFLQRWRIVVRKPEGPTGDIYFAYDYQFVENVREEDAERMRALYDEYRPVFFSSPVVAEQHDDTPAPKRGSRVVIDDDIPF
jgi:hypothetical protein